MYSLRRRVLSQNFLKSRKLAQRLIRNSSIGPKDTVLDIGSGRGRITEELLHSAGKVIGIELDKSLFFFLRKKFQESKHKLNLINKDFLYYELPEYPYKVFANIPFSIEGKIIRKLLDAKNPPEDAYLIVRGDLARRLMGNIRENQFSITHKPWFDFEIVHNFSRFDYEPVATMETVMLRFTKKKNFLISNKEKFKYLLLVEQGFNGGRRLKYNLRHFLTDKQFQKLSKELGFKLDSKPSDLNLNQWIRICEFLQK